MYLTDNKLYNTQNTYRAELLFLGERVYVCVMVMHSWEINLQTSPVQRDVYTMASWVWWISTLNFISCRRGRRFIKICNLLLCIVMFGRHVFIKTEWTVPWILVHSILVNRFTMSSIQLFEKANLVHSGKPIHIHWQTHIRTSWIDKNALKYNFYHSYL